ncbi:ribitol-5-phosphate dehydrogenase [Pediococcus claussenii]|uniref:Ribulose-5-phosphate reductase n=1 Tax=Pediococcus claussenii (strain ATCC BAA-344 / DSM 14800 / JCM 18046 / KCTC 3811 / LMG 21948 / P06) TaxID=701521 RepID=G8PC72_PEDCP|nr:ribitol-5-phosphate dehydrogenase [Pediococcus claussenii]AEV96050.1 zinc-binding dehydrogenase family protein [Pediococcus claussenii ATCC BAA-344]KRN19426.1 hypothetical protein IV79_GL001478 [Pediococcus claussenii]
MLNQVYRLVSPRQIETQTVNENLGTDDIIVRPTYLSVCHADQRYFTGQRPPQVLSKKLPMALIHEAIGTVVRDPQGIFKVGDTVAMIPDTPFEKDPIIRENYLPTTKFRSSGYDGFMQEYVYLRRDRAVKVPDDFNLEMSAFLEMVSVGVRALMQLKETMDADDQSLGIWGDGNLGYITAVLAKSIFPDTKLYIFGRHQEKLAYFSFADETYVVDSIPDDLTISQAIECTGGAGSAIAIDQIINHIKPMGTAILMGVTEEPVDINTRDVLAKGLILQGTSRSGREDFEKAIEILSASPEAQSYLQNLIGITKTVTTIPEIIDFFDMDLANSWGKAVMHWKV